MIYASKMLNGNNVIASNIGVVSLINLGWRCKCHYYLLDLSTEEEA